MHDAAIDPVTGDQNMPAEGFTVLREYDKLYEARWRRSVV